MFLDHGNKLIIKLLVDGLLLISEAFRLEFQLPKDSTSPPKDSTSPPSLQVSFPHFHNKAERRKAYLKARRAGTVLGELELKPKGFTDEQKAINKKLDDQLIPVIQKHADGAVLENYMKAKFTLTHRDFPHRMVF